MLPVLVRRLVSETTKTTELAMPGGDSVGQPGWDGILNVAEGNAWVPVGSSRWEMGCDKNVGRKAATEFKKRTEVTGSAEAAGLDFVFVSPRRWPGKKKWIEDTEKAAPWRRVRVIDADDLEAWLESAPGVALWFGEELGLAGPGIRAVSSYWDTWRAQSTIPLTVEAISAGRQPQIEAFRDTLSKAPALLVIEADSTEEAGAFACAELLALGLAESAACVTAEEGWRYADANPRLRILVAASPEIARARAAKAGQTLILPLNIGDRPDFFTPLAAQAAEQRIPLERPDGESFEKALIGLGEDEADAARLTRSTGRSWSVYRRVKALNQAIAHPAWMKNPAARALTAIVLVGGWNESRAGDVACLESVTGKKYEELERDLLHLARQDDPPVLKIGAVWKAKAPLELQYLYAKEITGEELKRFFATAQAILAKPDPALELEPSQRWMSAVYGKVRDESGIVIGSIVDSLAKLSVYAENVRDERIASGIADLVHTLLDGADGNRWLSLSGVFRELAEAAPETFLAAVEGSLRRPDAPIHRLVTESGGDQFFSRNWHVDLLWALEILAWSPRHLGRVVVVLAQLPAPAQQNLTNRPMNTLTSLLRPWWPQTTATPEQRLGALDRLIKEYNDVAWQLLVSVMPRHQMMASANAKPHWRDDDAGAPGPSERFGEYLSELGARVVAQAQGKPKRIAQLIEDLDSFGGQYREQIVRLVETSIGFPDEDREILREGLRKYLSWHFTYNRDGRKGKRDTADRLRPQFDVLAPADLVVRHAWAFQNGWVALPDGRDDDYEKADELRGQLRAAALKEIYEARGWAGVEDLLERAGSPWLVGHHIACAGLLEAELVTWARRWFVVKGNPFHDQALGGLIGSLPPDRRILFLEQACAGLEPAAIAAFASAASCDRATWDYLEAQSLDASLLYWQNIRPRVLLLERDDMAYAVDRLIGAKRHRTALDGISLKFSKSDPTQVLALLEAIAGGAEPDGPLPDGHHIAEALKHVQQSGIATRRKLAQMEFAYFRALQHHHSTDNLFADMLEHPEMFVECIMLAFRRASDRGTPAEPADEHKQAMASLAWTILHDGRGIPGRREDETVDREKFDAWISAARKLALEQDRLTPADANIGEWLSECPADPDGTWPCLPVRELLELPDAESIRNGFQCGVRNNRGVHSRAVGDGGNQERDLAAKYRSLAGPLQGSHPMTAAVLENIAQAYDYDASRHDTNASLWKEGAR